MSENPRQPLDASEWAEHWRYQDERERLDFKQRAERAEAEVRRLTAEVKRLRTEDAERDTQAFVTWWNSGGWLPEDGISITTWRAALRYARQGATE